MFCEKSECLVCTLCFFWYYANILSQNQSHHRCGGSRSGRICVWFHGAGDGAGPHWVGGCQPRSWYNSSQNYIHRYSSCTFHKYFISESSHTHKKRPTPHPQSCPVLLRALASSCVAQIILVWKTGLGAARVWGQTIRWPWLNEPLNTTLILSPGLPIFPSTGIPLLHTPYSAGCLALLNWEHGSLALAGLPGLLLSVQVCFL